MADKTRQEQDRDIAQRGLREALAFLQAITPSGGDTFYKIGQAEGTIKMALAESGGNR